MSNFELERFDSPDALAGRVAQLWIERIREAARKNRRQIVALSGGRIAKAFFQTTTRLAFSEAVSFRNVEIFWGDERCVPAMSDDSNYKLARTNLLDPLAVNPAHVHPLCAEDDGRSTAVQAAERLRAIASTNEQGVPEIDLVFLGMGEDGHVASLFPEEAEAARNLPDIYRPVTATKPPPQRITIGYPVIAAAREVWVLASGAGKAHALEESLKHDGITPLARVLQSRPSTRIFTDI